MLEKLIEFNEVTGKFKRDRKGHTERSNTLFLSALKCRRKKSKNSREFRNLHRAKKISSAICVT